MHLGVGVRGENVCGWKRIHSICLAWIYNEYRVVVDVLLNSILFTPSITCIEFNKYICENFVGVGQRLLKKNFRWREGKSFTLKYLHVSEVYEANSILLAAAVWSESIYIIFSSLLFLFVYCDPIRKWMNNKINPYVFFVVVLQLYYMRWPLIAFTVEDLPAQQIFILSNDIERDCQTMSNNLTNRIFSSYFSSRV